MIRVKPKVQPAYATVPCLWPGATFACIANGPSLTAEDVTYVRDRGAKLIVVNDGFRIAPSAAVLYAPDAKWIQWYDGVPSFLGLKYTMTREAWRWPGWQRLKDTGGMGLETARHGLRTAHHSGYQILNLAYHLGAKRIVMLGYDMQLGPNGETHWHGDHRDGSKPHFDKAPLFETIVAPLAAAGVTVINCTRRTALRCFPLQPLSEALPVEYAHA